MKTLRVLGDLVGDLVIISLLIAVWLVLTVGAWIRDLVLELSHRDG